jgi:hypothetical protein
MRFDSAQGLRRFLISGVANHRFIVALHVFPIVIVIGAEKGGALCPRDDTAISCGLTGTKSSTMLPRADSIWPVGDPFLADKVAPIDRYTLIQS